MATFKITAGSTRSTGVLKLLNMQMGRSRVSHTVRASNIWLLHLLHLLSSPSQAEAERVVRQLCTGLLLHRSPLVGWTGQQFAAFLIKAPPNTLIS